MPYEDPDLSFAQFGGSKRLYPAPGISGNDSESSNSLKNMARREGFELPTLRFEERRKRPYWGLTPSPVPI